MTKETVRSGYARLRPEPTLEDRINLTNLFLLKPRPTWSFLQSIVDRVEMRRRRVDLQKSNLFNESWYLEEYPDLNIARLDPLRHFLCSGSYEGRSPGPSFDSMGYLRRYKDVANARIEPWRHYFLYGKAEHRWPSGELVADEDLSPSLETKYDEIELKLNSIKATQDAYILGKNLVHRVSELERHFNNLSMHKLPLERLSSLEQVKGQWQAGIPRILDKLKSLENISEIDRRIKELEAHFASKSTH